MRLLCSLSLSCARTDLAAPPSCTPFGTVRACCADMGHLASSYPPGADVLSSGEDATSASSTGLREGTVLEAAASPSYLHSGTTRATTTVPEWPLRLLALLGADHISCLRR